MRSSDNAVTTGLSEILKEAQLRKETKNATNEQRLQTAADIEEAKAAVKLVRRTVCIVDITVIPRHVCDNDTLFG